MAYKTYKPGRSGNVIYVFNNDVEAAIRTLKHTTTPLMKELKMKRYFEPNTAKRRRKMKEAIIKGRQRQRLAEQFF